MSRLPFIVIADDLTGAAELAALAHQAGLRAVVLTEAPRRAIATDVIVCDSGTRLATPAVAARKVGQLARRLRAIPNAGIFKKVDSVLRGNVMAEIEACMEALDLPRTLLVPCNPSLGRIINNGRYFIAGVPLHRTDFAREPHHPRKTCLVDHLLADGSAPVQCYHTADELPENGVSVGEASSPADVSLWASRLDDKTFPAGGADFFRMWIHHHRAGRRVARPTTPDLGATLMLSGTATPTDPVTPVPGPQIALKPNALPKPAPLAAEATAHLKSAKRVSVFIQVTPKTGKGSSKAINRMFSTLVRRLRPARAFKHVLIAGGTTTALVLESLGWHRLEVVHVWGPGVVTLRPTEAPQFAITTKPGSYPWPVSLRRHFAAIEAAAE
jgi:uncharacterized protein YgbK (DUF1537 family)